MESQGVIPPPAPELRSQLLESLALPQLGRSIVETIDHRQFQVRDPAPNAESQARSIAVQWNDLDARQTLEHRAIDDDQGPAIPDRHQFSVGLIICLG